MKHKYSKVNSGRKIKGFPMTHMSERNPIKTVSFIKELKKKCVDLVFQISIVEDESNESEEMEAKVEIINKNFLNNSFDDQTLKRLWTETHEYRQSFIKQHTTADIIEQFPAYSNPSMVIINFNIFVVILLLQILADAKMLTNVDLDDCIKEKMDILSSKICSDNQFPTGI